MLIISFRSLDFVIQVSNTIYIHWIVKFVLLKILLLTITIYSKISKNLFTVATTNWLLKYEVGRAFPDGNLDNEHVKAISFPGICLILKLTAKSRFSQRVSLLCIVSLH